MTEKPRRVSRELPCALTDDEKLEVGKLLAAKEVEIEALRAKVALLNADKRPLIKQRLELGKKLDSGVELREVMCEVEEGPGVNITFRRVDTGEVVEKRAMTPEERQAKMAGGDWLSETEAAIARAKGKQPGAAGSDDDDDPDNVVPFGSGKGSGKKAARKPRKGPPKGGKR